MNPEQIIEFIGPNFDKKKDADNIEDTQYTLTVHDLLSAFHFFNPCASCSHCKKSGPFSMYEEDCFDCKHYYGSKWEAKP